MQLLYVYMNIASRGINKELNFNSKYIINFEKENRQINIIDNKKYERINHFYGNNIGNMELIVGNNGAGKTTLLDLIGINDLDLFDRFKHSDEWLLIYENNNKFVIEGHQSPSEECIISSFSYNKDINITGFNGEFISSILQKEENHLVFSKINYRDSDNFSIWYLPSTYDPLSEVHRQIKFSDTSSSDIFEWRYHRNYLFYGFRHIYRFISSQIYEDLKFFNKEIKINLKINDNEENYEALSDFINHLHPECPIMIMEHRFTGSGLKYDLEKNEKFVLKFLYLNLFKMYFFYISKFNKDIKPSISEIECQEMFESINKNINKLNDFQSIYDYLHNVVLEIKNKIRITDNIHISIDNLFRICDLLIGLNMNELLDFTSSSNCILKAYSKENNKKFYDEVYEFAAKLDSLKGNPFFGTYDFGLKAYIPGLSSGERQIICIISSLYSMSYFDKTLLILDEPDIALHPEWSRMLVHYINRFFEVHDKEINVENNDKKIELKLDVIMSTHSPLLLSDFFKASTHLFKWDDKEYTVNLAEKTLCGNIGDLMVNNFFIKKPFGEYSYNKIAEYIDLLKKSIGDKGKIEEDKLIEIEALINNISDELIRHTLKYYYEEYLKESQQVDTLIKYKQKMVQKLQEEISRLENKNA